MQHTAVGCGDDVASAGPRLNLSNAREREQNESKQASSGGKKLKNRNLYRSGHCRHRDNHFNAKRRQSQRIPARLIAIVQVSESCKELEGESSAVRKRTVPRNTVTFSG